MPRLRRAVAALLIVLLVALSPVQVAAQTQLVTGLAGGNLDGLETLLTSILGTTDGIETLIGTTNTTLTTIDGRVDGLEALLTTQAGYLDGLEGFVDGIEALLATSNTNTGNLSAMLTALQLIDNLPNTLGSTTSGQSGVLGLGAVTTSAPTYTNGQSNAFSLNTSGELRVALSGGGSNAAASATGSAVPSAADYLGLNVSGTLRGQTGLSLGSQFAGTVAIVDGSGAQVTAFGGSGGTASNFGSAFPSAGTAAGMSDGTNMVGFLGTTTQADNLANTLDALNSTSFAYWFDGTTWDRARGDSTDGLLVNLGANNDVTITGSVTVTDGAGALNVIVDSGTVTTVSTVTSVSQWAGTAIPLLTATLGDDLANTQDALATTSLLYVFDGTTWDRLPGTSALGVTTNTELPAAATLADDTANPSLPAIAAYLMVFDGTTWDRARVATDMTIGTAFATSGPGIVASYKDFDGSALPTTANVGTEEEATPFAASIVGVQYVMAVNEDGSTVGHFVCDSGCGSGTVYDQGEPITLSAANGVIGGGRVSAAAPSTTGVIDDDFASFWLLATGAQVGQPSFAGVLAVAGSGANGTGVQRFTLATDDEINDDADAIRVATETIDNAISGAGFNITQFAGATVPMTTTQADDLALTLDGLNVASFLYMFDGTNMDLVRGNTTDGLLVNLGANNDVTVTSGTVTTVSTVTNVSQWAGAAIPMTTTQADDLANTLDGLNTTSFAYIFDGATWDRWTGAVTISGAALTALQLIDDPVFADEAAFTYATSKVFAFGAVAESTTDALADGAVGAPVMTLSRFLRTTPSGYATGGAAPVVMLSDNTNNDDETAICTADCTVYSITAFNHAAAAAFLRCEADTTGNTTPGSETAAAGEFDLEIPGATTGSGFTVNFPTGVSYAGALTCWLATGEASSDTTDPGQDDVRVLFTRVQ